MSTTDDIPYGYCHCGCGQQTRLATKTCARDGRRKGAPMRYLRGHSGGGNCRPGGPTTPLHEVFWSLVLKDGPTPPHCPDLGSCWVWTGGLTGDGYGRIHHSGRSHYAHRLSYEMNVGAIPAGLFVCHRCDNPSCVNPAHLFLGTNADNVADMVSKRRQVMPRLTPSDVYAIRAGLMAGRAHRDLAREYGVHPTLIGQIKRRQVWGRLP